MAVRKIEYLVFYTQSEQPPTQKRGTFIGGRVVLLMTVIGEQIRTKLKRGSVSPTQTLIDSKTEGEPTVPAL